MADPGTAAPLEITISPKPSFAPDIAIDGPAVAPPRPIGQDAGQPDHQAGDTFGDTYTKLAQMQEGRAARAILDRLAAEEGAAATKAAQPAADALEQAAPRAAAAGRSFGSAVADVARDVGRGVMQSPRAVAQGAGEAVRQVMTATDHLATWLNDNVANLNVPIPRTGIEAVDKTLANPAAAIAGAVPTLGAKPDTVTAGIVHDAAQFLTGMAIGGKALEGAGIVLGGFGKVAATGAFSDFAARDPDAKRLADLIEKYPALKNPVTGFLQAKEGDPEGLKRLKAAVEGVGMGAMAEGFIRGVSLVRSRMNAGKAVTEHGKLLKTMEEDAEKRFGRLSDEALAIMGDPNAPLLKTLTEGQKASIAARRIEAGGDMARGVPTDDLVSGLVKTTDAGGQEVYVNFARIEAADDVKKVIGLMADAGKEAIDAKRGGARQTFAQMEELAGDLNMSVTDLLARRSGSPMNAAEALAARSLLAASATNLTVMANRIASGAAGPAMEFAFRRQMAVHAAIQAEVIAARTETARALASWNIPRGGGIEAAKAVQETLAAMGGSETTRELALRLSQIQGSRPNSLGPIAEFVRKSVTARTIDAAMEAWKSALLSGPTTHLANIFSNSLTMAISLPERKLAEALSQWRGTAEGVAAGEANALAHGMVTASKEAFRMAWYALKTGEGQFGRAAGKADLNPIPAISKEALGLPDNVWGNSVDYIGKGFNIPFRFLTAEDEFFKTITYRAELHAQAARVATSEGLDGAAASARMKEIVDNPPEAVKLAATDFALASTYNRELTGALAKIAQARSSDGFVGRAMQFVLPFFRTPVNVFSASVERSPLAFLTQQFRSSIEAGGARRDLALAQMATGTTIMLVAADLADQGLITGMVAKDPGAKEARERQGIPPYSIKIGDKWVSYNRADPLAMPMAVAANMAELARRFEIEPDKVDSVREIMAAAIGGTAKAALDRSFMQGMAGLTSAIVDPEQHADQYVKSTITGFVTPAILNTATQLTDPTRRETFNALDAIEARIPEISKTLIPRMDLWGREVRLAESGAGRGFDVISPVKVQSEKPNPIDEELVRLNFFPKRIPKRGSWDGAPVEFANFPEVYAEYARLAGNATTMPMYDDKGAMDFLNDLVAGKSGNWDAYWQMQTDGPEGGKAQFIQKVIGDYRKEARRAIESDPRFPEFRQYLAQQGTDHAVKRAPTQPERDAAPMIPRIPALQ